MRTSTTFLLTMKLRYTICAMFAVLFPTSCCLIDQPQKRLQQARMEWMQNEEQQLSKKKIEEYNKWKARLGSIVSAEFAHRAPTEENPTPTIIIKLSPEEVQELVAILSDSRPGGSPGINPDTIPLELNAQGEVVYSLEIEGRYFDPIDDRTDFLHLYDADGNEIMPELSPYEDDIYPVHKVRVLDLRRKDTPAWEQPFVLLEKDGWNRFWQLPSFVKFREAVRNVQAP